MSGPNPIRPQGAGPEGRTVRSGRAVRRRTGEPPRPGLPQPVLKIGLIALFVLAAAWVFRPDSGDDSPAEGGDPEGASDEVADLPAPSLRLVGEWAYVLNDEEVEERDDLESRLRADGDDAISRAMLTGLEQRLANRMSVTPTQLSQTVAGQSTDWSWEAIRETDSTVELVLTAGATTSQAVAELEGMDWVALRITRDEAAEDAVLKQRWRRVKKAKAAVTDPTAPTAEAAGQTSERSEDEASAD